MPKRMPLFVPAIFVILLATVASTARPSVAQRAADECITKPSSQAPQGSHWYYRVDRASKRHCWFLGPQGANVRALQAASPKRLPAPGPVSQATVEAPAQIAPAQIAPAQVVPVQVVPVQVVPVQTASAEVTAGDNGPAPAFSMRSAEPAKSAGIIDREPTSMSNADEQSAPASPDEMPLVWPVLTPADVSGAQPAPESTIRTELMLAFLAGALALAAMIAERMVKRSAARRLRRSDLGDQSDPPPDATLPREHVSPAFARSVTPARQADTLRKPVVAATRRAGAHEPDQTSDPGYDIEERLRRLLHDWQRAAA